MSSRHRRYTKRLAKGAGHQIDAVGDAVQLRRAATAGADEPHGVFTPGNRRTDAPRAGDPSIRTAGPRGRATTHSPA